MDSVENDRVREVQATGASMKERAVDLARGRWASVLAHLGIPEEVLNPRRHFRCPKDGSGTDRFRFADNNGSGSYFCACSNGDKGGMALLMCCKGWTYAEAATEVEKIVGLVTPVQVQDQPDPRPRLKALQESCIAPADAVIQYLEGRGLKPSEATRQAKVRYWENGEPQGLFDGMVHKVSGPDGKPLTFHVTYLDEGKKADVSSPRKLMPAIGPLAGAAIRLGRGAEEMGIAEGIETALSASELYKLPVWSAINTTLLEKFDPPSICKRLWIFGDSDRSFAGQKSAYALAERLAKTGLEVHVLIPPEIGDWNDVLMGNAKGKPTETAATFP